jgi:tetratricopeptide (TPR) repeat protein
MPRLRRFPHFAFKEKFSTPAKAFRSKLPAPLVSPKNALQPIRTYFEAVFGKDSRMTLRKQLAALAVAGLALPGCTNPLLAPSGRHESREMAVARDNYPAGRLLASLFGSPKSPHAARAAGASTRPDSRYGALARRLEERGETAEAQKLYEAALRENPDDGAVHQRLGVLLARRGETTAAEHHLRAAAIHNPASVEAANDLGYCYFLQGRFAEAEAELRRALEIDPNHLIAANNLANVVKDRAALVAASTPSVTFDEGTAPRMIEPAVAKSEPIAEPTAALPKATSEKLPNASTKSPQARLAELPRANSPTNSEAKNGETSLITDLPGPATQASIPPARPLADRAEGSPPSVLPQPRENEESHSLPSPIAVREVSPESISARDATSVAEAARDEAPVARRIARGAASSESAVVRLVEQSRFIAPCASPAVTETNYAVEEPQSEEEDVQILPLSAASREESRVSLTEEPWNGDFERYAPTAPNAISPPASQTRWSVIDAIDAAPSVRPSALTERLFTSTRADREPMTTGPRTSSPPPSPSQRRSLMSTLRRLNPLDAEPHNP